MLESKLRTCVERASVSFASQVIFENLDRFCQNFEDQFHVIAQVDGLGIQDAARIVFLAQRRVGAANVVARGAAWHAQEREEVPFFTEGFTGQDARPEGCLVEAIRYGEPRFRPTHGGAPLSAGASKHGKLEQHVKYGGEVFVT